jgi:hypothetical protein
MLSAQTVMSCFYFLEGCGFGINGGKKIGTRKRVWPSRSDDDGRELCALSTRNKLKMERRKKKRLNESTAAHRRASPQSKKKMRRRDIKKSFPNPTFTRSPRPRTHKHRRRKKPAGDLKVKTKKKDTRNSTRCESRVNISFRRDDYNTHTHTQRKSVGKIIFIASASYFFSSLF